MSINMVSTLPQTPLATTGDSVAGALAAASGQSNALGFLGLLLGQLSTSNDKTLVSLEGKIDEIANALDTLDEDQADPLAILGMLPAEIQTAIASLQTEKPVATSALEKHLETPSLAASGSSRKTEVTLSDNTGINGSADSAEATTSLSLAQAAKFAVEPLPSQGKDTTKPQEAFVEPLPATVLATGQGPSHTTTRHDASLAVNTPVHATNWHDDFTQKIVWMASSDKQSAQITLNPPQMGPIEVTLNLDKGNATASFVSANTEVREAIETAIPRLREMFANAGIDLGQTNVSTGSFQQQADHTQHQDFGASRNTADGSGILAAGVITQASVGTYGVTQGRGLVDTFA